MSVEVETLTKEEFAALPKARQVEITAELLRARDLETIKRLGVRIMTDEEFEAEDRPPDVVEIENLS